jgi:predicted RNA-binding protein
MAYYLDIFSPETYESFLKSSQDITGFRLRQSNAARRIKPKDKLICYMTEFSRWIGILEILSESFVDNTPRFYDKNDPFVVRFKVKPLVWLPKEQAIPIHEDFVWNQLPLRKDTRSMDLVGQGCFGAV